LDFITSGFQLFCGLREPRVNPHTHN